jgi:L-threonylcarbamoyladenylate synthase
MAGKRRTVNFPQATRDADRKSMPPRTSRHSFRTALSVPVPIPPAQRELVRRALADGLVMTYPTETFYALGGNALDAGLVNEIYRLKGRGAGKPLPLLVDARRGLDGWVGEPPPEAERLMARFWPGPLTLVLPAGPRLPPHLRDARGNVALRWSPHPAIAELLALGEVPLIGTSANRSGAPGLNTAQAVLDAFDGEPILALDGGPAPGGAPSTVLDVTVRPFDLVRAGAVPVAELRAALAETPDLAPVEAR